MKHIPACSASVTVDVWGRDSASCLA